MKRCSQSQAVTGVGLLAACLVLAEVLYQHALKTTPFPCSNNVHFGFPRCFDSQHRLEFVHNTLGMPDTHKGGRQDAFLDLDLKLFDATPEFTIVMSFHNHARVVSRSVGSLLNQTRGLWEAVFVFDDCQDASLRLVHDILRQWLQSKAFADVHCQTGVLSRVRSVVQPTSVWETSSDNLGLRISSPSRYYLLVQADMTDFEEAFNLKLSAPFDVFADVIAVSGRCSHNLVERFDGKGVAGRCGSDIAHPLTVDDLDAKHNILFVRETVNRGPLLLHAGRFQTIGFFDELNFYQGDDDHNAMLRAFTQYGWKSGHFQINFSSPLEFGAMRQSEFFVQSQSPSPYLQNRKQQIDLSDHIQMLESLSKMPQWDEDRLVQQSQVDSVLKQSRDRLRYLNRCLS